jgi:hypothetical protein
MIEAFDSNRTNIYTYNNVCVTKIKYSIFNVQDYIAHYNNVVKLMIKMKNKTYYTVGTLSNSISLTPKYMTVHFPGLVQVRLLKMEELS